MRSTEDKLIHIPLNVGMNQAVSERLAPTGTLSVVQNCRIPGNGILEKRQALAGIAGTVTGSSHIFQGNGSTTNVELPAFICQVQRALCVGTTFGDAFSYSSPKWQFCGRFSTCLPVRRRYGLTITDTMTNSGNGFGKFPPDIVVTTSGYICVAALTRAGDLHLYIEDQSGVRLLYRNNPTGVSRVRLTAQNDVIMVIYQIGTAITIDTMTISSGIVTESVAAGSATLSTANTSWDAVSYNQNLWFLVFESALNTATVQTRNLGAITQSATFAVAGTPEFSIWGDTSTSQVWIGFYDGAGAQNVSFFVIDLGLLVVKATTVLKNGASLGAPLFGRFRSSAVNTTNKTFYCFKQTADTGAATWVGSAEGGASAPTTPVACWHVIPISKPDNYNRVWCMVTAPSVSNQLLSRALLLRFSDVALSAPPTIELSTPNFGIIPSVNTLASAASLTWFGTIAVFGATSSYVMVPAWLQTFVSPTLGSDAIVRLDVLEYTSAEQETVRQTIPSYPTTIIAGQPVELFGQSSDRIENTLGISSAFNTGASEVGFPHAPIIFSIALGGAGNLVAGTRSWRVVYEWVDMYGRRHQSAPSAPISFTNVSTAAVALSISTTDITQRQSANTTNPGVSDGLRVYAKIYRTVAGGTEYHEHTRASIAFDQTDGLITFTDTESDTDLASAGFIYTDGGVLDDTLAPSCRFMCRSEDRYWFGGLWDSNIIQCSKIIVPGEPVQCTDDPSFQVQLPGECTGLAYMDGNVVAFTQTAIYLVGGDGPNDQGVGGFAPPRCLTRSVGCIDSRSIIETNVGVMFQANLGLYLLPRGFAPAQYVGAAVQAEMAATDNGQSSQIIGAATSLSRSDHLARFIVATGNTSRQTGSNQVLTYDIDSGMWFRDTIAINVGGITNFEPNTLQGIPGCAFIAGDISSTTPAPVLVESASPSVSAISQLLTTAWIQPFGLGGYGKVNAVLVAVEGLGDSQTLTITVQTDTNTAQTGVWTITGTDIAYRVLLIQAPRDCTAVQVSILGDSPPSVEGGFKFISLTLEVEPTNGIRLLADAEKK